ncbi:hypothetical protein [Homoserinibacter sp. GY 40078]|uniref:hypothetical protein n=1 Tax=Homoserinibacter sp. GY 40078 TaxID=2603275 RepID=UPI0011C888DB|nr:hypothetical protein [Homoserinibacter sp. GY 40078]TXK17385.1 hypothetical protein FVQ89_11160 [Homoserinibacter sp. GY 40078]
MDPTPLPIPLPVDFGPTLTDWLLVLVTALGVAASTTVAIAAWKTSQQAARIAETSHKAAVARALADDRREFVQEVAGWINDNRASLIDAAELTVSSSRIRVRAASLGVDGLGSWIREAADLIRAVKGRATVPRGKKQSPMDHRGDAVNKLRSDAEKRLIGWMLGGELDLTPFEMPPWG